MAIAPQNSAHIAFETNDSAAILLRDALYGLMFSMQFFYGTTQP